MVSRRGFILNVLLCLILTCTTQGESKKHFCFVDRKIKQDFIAEQHVLRSKFECIYTCSSKPSCLGASWLQTGNVCLLSDNTYIWYGEDSPYLEVTNGWTTMMEIQFPVILYRGPAGRYTLDYNAATNVCLQRQTTIASTTDVLNARAMGYAHCTCGWMDGQVLGLVQLQASPSCNNWFDTGIILCSATFGDVYCRLN